MLISSGIIYLTVKYFWQLFYICDNILASLTLEVYFFMNVSAESVFPEKYRILSGSTLKVIAVVTMLIDHIGAILLSMYQPALKTLFYTFRKRIQCVSDFS